ncbi:MAG: iron-sulfur cluster assembly accessory protein [Balneolaceae bacterium]|nr:iron-sulfur cluster assembly accessory protein [Balneolaceae bacterium]
MKDDELDDVIASLLDVDEESEGATSEAEGSTEAAEGVGTASDGELQKHPTLSDPTQATVSLTERAAKEVARIRTAEGLDEELILRVAVESGGCSGLSYKLGYDYPSEQDIRLESQGVSILLDPEHAPYLHECEVDYPEGLQARGFVFNNPNASESCGCGESFAV